MMAVIKREKYWFFASVLLLIGALFFLSAVVYAGVKKIKSASVSVDEKLSQNQSKNIVARSSMSYNLQRINASKLFYVKKERAKKVTQAKKTQLRLSLDGIISAEEPVLSRAIIRTNNKKPLTYEVGEEIEGTNAKLHTVEASQVIIERAGALESLELERLTIDQKKTKKE